MANQSAPFSTPIIGTQYCAPGPHPVDLIIIKERNIGENFTFTDMNVCIFDVEIYVQLRMKINVFLANNTTQVCDFKVKATWFRHSWDVYIGESDIVVAQINKKLGTMFSREKYMVTMCPNIDYAFIVALIATLES
ncbi:hypothetical protein VNO78_15561 [Psophocarpus tetragonolobus]|uniref:Protein LURP-one-related 15 n=1 Tax=Psophocarpus tetragonolobus TaxID=3891 RepID=A0AAN9SGP7_PSOTE